LKYKRDYTLTEEYKNSNIRMNVILLKNSLSNLVEDINYYLSQNNIKEVAIKFLDILNDTKYDKWIKENGLDYSNSNEVINIVNDNFKLIRHEYQNYYWKDTRTNKLISMYVNDKYNKDKTNENFMRYGSNQLKK